MTRQQETEPLAAFMAALASMAQAARRGGPGPRKRGRRTGGTGRRRNRRADIAFPDAAWAYGRRPADYVAAGIMVGSAGAFALVALGRAVRGRPDGGPGGTPLHGGLVRLRTVATRHRPQSAPGAPQQDDNRDEVAGVTTMPTPATASTPGESDGAGRPARHTSGAAWRASAE
jgi:hypothetical protein